MLNGIKNHSYQNRRFYILERPENKFKSRVLLVPRGFIDNPKIIADIKVLENLATPYRASLSSFISEITNSLPIYRNLLSTDFTQEEISQIQIRPVIWGTLGSFPNRQGEYILYPRSDRNPNQVFQLIVNVLITQRYFKDKGTNPSYDLNPSIWKEKQSLVNQITKKILKLNPTALEGTTDSLVNTLQKNYKGNLVKQSAKNFAKLGYPIKQSIDLKVLRPRLTKKEFQILNELSENKLEIVTFDKLSEILWKENAIEKFSLYAITKRVERLRTKLKKNGISENTIHTQRGEGYVLFD